MVASPIGGAAKLDIRFISIDELHPHEVILPNLIEEVSSWIADHGVLPHPVIVVQIENASFLVADGHHRVEALRRLGCEVVLAHVVDPDDRDSAVLKSWAHRVGIDAETLAETTRSLSEVAVFESDPREAHLLTWNRRAAAAIRDETHAWVIRAAGSTTPQQALRLVHQKYADAYVDAVPVDSDTPSFQRSGEGKALVLLSRLTVGAISHEVITLGHLFIPKLTRFVLPHGKLAEANCPLEIQRPGVSSSERDEWLQTLEALPPEYDADAAVRRFKWD